MIAGGWPNILAHGTNPKLQVSIDLYLILLQQCYSISIPISERNFALTIEDGAQIRVEGADDDTDN